jgi:ribosomal protein L17
MERDRKMEKELTNERGRLTAEQTLKMLKEENLEVTLEQARQILEFLRKLANLTVSNYINNKNEKDSRPIRESEYGRTSGERIFPKEPRRSAKKALYDK